MPPWSDLDTTHQAFHVWLVSSAMLVGDSDRDVYYIKALSPRPILSRLDPRCIRHDPLSIFIPRSALMSLLIYPL